MFADHKLLGKNSEEERLRGWIQKNLRPKTQHHRKYLEDHRFESNLFVLYLKQFPDLYLEATQSIYPESANKLFLPEGLY